MKDAPNWGSPNPPMEEGRRKEKGKEGS